MSVDGSITRRRALAASAAALATFGLIGSQRARAYHGMQGGGGIVGGGLAKMADGEANVALAALILRDEASDSANMEIASVLGRFVWIARDDAGREIALESLKLSGYKYLYDLEEGDGREVYGYLSVNGGGDHPFTIRVVDAGRPGEGKDTITLDVGSDLSASANPFTYSATASLTTGGFETVHFGSAAEYEHSH